MVICHHFVKGLVTRENADGFARALFAVAQNADEIDGMVSAHGLRTLEAHEQLLPKRVTIHFTRANILPGHRQAASISADVVKAAFANVTSVHRVVVRGVIGQSGEGAVEPVRADFALERF